MVSKEEATASAEAATVKTIKDECEADLAEALPALEAAISALNTLKPADITEVKGMKSPPGGVRRVLEAICIMKGGAGVCCAGCAAGLSRGIRPPIV